MPLLKNHLTVVLGFIHLHLLTWYNVCIHRLSPIVHQIPDVVTYSVTTQIHIVKLKPEGIDIFVDLTT